MSPNWRSLTRFGIVLAALALVVAVATTKGFGLFAEAPEPLPSNSIPAEATPIRLPCAELRTLIEAPVLGHIEQQPGMPGTFTDTWFTCVSAGYASGEDPRTTMIRVTGESHRGWATPESIADRGKATIEAHCDGAALTLAPDGPFSASCTARTDRFGGVAGWSNVKDLIGVTVEIHYYDPAHLKTLADAQSTTPDALLAATAAQVGQAVLAGL